MQNFKIFKTPIIRKSLIISAVLFCLSVILYHNNASYSFFSSKINPRIIKFTGWDMLESVNSLARYLDVVGATKRLFNPLDEIR